ncbi:MAG: hypothetical protein ACM359_01755 [Bacillota bacterium]
MRPRLFAFLAILAMPLFSLAQPLADRVPADAILYLGWQGSQSLGPTYDQTHTKAILDASNIPQFFTQTLQRLTFRVQRDNPQAAQLLQLATAVGGPLWQHPSAIFFSGMNYEAAGHPQPKIAIVCRADNDADSLFARFNDIAALPGGAAQVQAYRLGKDVALAIGFAPGANPLAGEGTALKPIATSDRLTQSLAQVHKNPVAIAYLDADLLRATLDQALQQTNDPQAQMYVPKIREALGMTGIKSFICTGAFEGADWSTQAFLAAPAPRTGLLTQLDQPAVSEDLLRSIPSSASWLAVARFNAAKFLQELRTAAGKVDPQAQTVFDQVMGVAQLTLTMNIQKDLFEPLGDQWALYHDPAATGAGPLGITLINRLERPEDAQRAFTKLDLFIDNMANARLARQKLRLNFEAPRVGDLTVHYVSLPLIAPAWTIKGNNLYVALYPQVVIAAAQTPAQAKTILDNPDYQAIQKRLAVKNPTAVSFIDSSRAVENSYQKILALSQLGLGSLDTIGVKTPTLVLPPLNTLRPHLTPAGSASWTDDAGWHHKALHPFPCLPLLGCLP